MPGLEAPLDEYYLRSFQEAAGEFAGTPGGVSNEIVEKFMATYPLPTLFRILELSETGSDLENLTVRSLDRIFRSSFGPSILPQVLANASEALKASSPAIRQLACQSVGLLVEGGGEVGDADVAEDIRQELADSESSVAEAASEALKKMAKFQWGLNFIFRDNRLLEMLSASPSTVRMRIYSLAVSISELSEEAKTEVQNSQILKNLSRELLVSDNDPLTAVNAIEGIRELANSQNGAELLVDGDFLSRLCSVARSRDGAKIVRIPALACVGQLAGLQKAHISHSDVYMVVDTLSSVLDDLREREERGEGGLEEEYVTAVDAVGQLGLSREGGEALMAGGHAAARHVVASAFTGQGPAQVQLVGVHSLASIAGAEREGERGREGERESPLLSLTAEENFRKLVLSQAAMSAWGPDLSDVILSLLRQAEEMRVAVYRLMSAMARREWALREMCGSVDIVTFVADSRTENTRPAMEWRHACCVALWTSAQHFETSLSLSLPPQIKDLLASASRRGPFLSENERREAIPIVATAQRM